VAAPAPTPAGKADALPTQSILSPYELSLGAVCGICAGVFIKKGAKLIAFFLGGVYVLMQVSLHSRYLGYRMQTFHPL
jgi:FUN14 domain-containing protein 1